MLELLVDWWLVPAPPLTVFAVDLGDETRLFVIMRIMSWIKGIKYFGHQPSSGFRLIEKPAPSPAQPSTASGATDG